MGHLVEVCIRHLTCLSLGVKARDKDFGSFHLIGCSAHKSIL